MKESPYAKELRREYEAWDKNNRTPFPHADGHVSRPEWDAFLEELLQDRGPGRQRMCLLSFWLARTKQRDMDEKKKAAL